jgi:peptidoglycan/xylan/chitin deacetylase (PgdA/CDA1 family)
MIRFLLILFIFIYGCTNNDKNAQGQSVLTQIDPNHEYKQVVVFVYHRFGDNRYPSTNISTDMFDKHLSYLKSNNFTVLNFSEAVDYIKNPDLPYHSKVACLTVDDGYKSFKENGIPLLKKYGFTATLFINSESVGGGTYLDWDELKYVQEQGIEIGNHSHSHAYFVNLPEKERVERFKEDVNICQEAIRKNLGFTPDIFAYPYGEFDPAMQNALKSMGFKAAAAQNSGVMHLDDIFAIPRFPMAGTYVAIDAFREKALMKAMRVTEKSSYSFLMQNENPPTLTVSFGADSVDLARANCFISNGCDMTIEGNQITIRSEKPLSGRRTLYTITAQGKSGKGWYWFSHLWIRPEIPE